ncbi:MAG: hypothetical protein KJ706_09770 [Candidatus Omnitrophica bacterium]|nr:hypothetical protein [Candidatus Omnitrophota bacterium]MBU4590478.1 hypothetical protein [Candidatus Omnitrophota bacterium]
MSIINDAIKKARKESGIEERPIVIDGVAIPEKKIAPVSSTSETRWMTAVVVSLVIVASLFGSLALYKHIVRLNAPYETTVTSAAQPQEFSPAPYVRQRVSLPAPKAEAVLELNGIVHGPEDKWAIINDRIVREGDSLLGGKLTHIAKDFVKIKKDSGDELVLDLR